MGSEGSKIAQLPELLHKPQLERDKSRPTFKSVAPICVSILCASGGGSLPGRNGFDYDPDSGQYISNLTLHAFGFGLQEILQLFEFGG